MSVPNYVLLFVDSPKASGAFYSDLLGVEPVETSPTFCLFALPNGLMFGLWSRHTAEPTPAEMKKQMVEDMKKWQAQQALGQR